MNTLSFCAVSQELGVGLRIDQILSRDHGIKVDVDVKSSVKVSISAKGMMKRSQGDALGA